MSPLRTGPRLLSALRAPGGSRPSFIFEPKVMDVGSVAALIRWYLHQRLSDEFISSSYLVLPGLTWSYLVLPLITSSHHFEALRKLKRTLQQARGSIFWQLREDMWKVGMDRWRTSDASIPVWMVSSCFLCISCCYPFIPIPALRASDFVATPGGTSAPMPGGQDVRTWLVILLWEGLAWMMGLARYEEFEKH